MAELSLDYTPHYRWEWFRRAQWQGTFRERKRASCGGFAELVRERGLADEPVLDCSCGLGLKTIVLREAGLRVEGSDKCALAVEHARLLAAEEGHPGLHFFVSTWEDLPAATGVRYAAVFNDALSWVDSGEEMAASVRGLHDVLRPGGLLVYQGAQPGSHGDRAALLDAQWQAMLAEHGRCGLGFRASDGARTVQEILVHERGPHYVDRHHLYLIEEPGQEPRLEATTMRHGCKWDWCLIEPHLRAAGFTGFGVKSSTAADGRVRQFVVAERE